MKKTLLIAMAFCLAVAVSAQYRGAKQMMAKHIAPAWSGPSIDFPTTIGNLPPNNYVSNKSISDDPVSSVTKYDLQTNASVERRLYLYPDGTVGTAATWSNLDTPFADRGTGYNYFNGTAFGTEPAARIESIRTGWPSYLPFGTDGELVVCHQATGNLVMNTCPNKGSGVWTQKILPNALPTGVPAMWWPRAVTNGIDRTNIHIIALTYPVANGGVIYNGIDGALLYCRSTDGGVTFSAWTQLPGLTSTSFSSFGGDSYSFAEPKGDTLAFTVGGDLDDLVLMKSTDNGVNWTKTVIWHSLYSLGGTSPSFYAACDGSQYVVLDNAGTAHVTCGYAIDSAYNASNHYYSRTASGILYWNEHMPQLRQDLDQDSLFKHHQLIGWLKDTSVNSFPLANLTLVGGGLTRWPSLVIDKRDHIYLVFGGATTFTDPDGNNFRHIFGRDGVLAGDTVYWSNDTLVDITGDWLTYSFSDCMYPSVSPTSMCSITGDNVVYILFQKDDYAGSYVSSIGATNWVGQTSPTDNSISLLLWTKPINESVNEKQEKPTLNVSQNFPNPVNGLTTVNVYLLHSGDISLKVTNVTGQTLMTMEKSNVQPGMTQFVIDGSQLTSGVYFYTVKQGNKTITKKMVVQ